MAQRAGAFSGAVLRAPARLADGFVSMPWLGYTSKRALQKGRFFAWISTAFVALGPLVRSVITLRYPRITLWPSHTRARPQP